MKRGTDTIHLMAADWVARLREPEVSLEETLEWQNWMSEDARHAAAFASMEEVSNFLQKMPRPARPLTSAIGPDGYDAEISLGEWEAARRRRQGLALAASLLIVATGSIAWVAASRESLPGSAKVPQLLQTAVGENRNVTLADGSRVTLGGNTRVSITLSNGSRRLDLVRGEAYFSVAKDVNRPFAVHAGKATVVALGTEFNVRRVSDRVVVSVIEGRVRVEPETRILPVALVREFNPKFAAVKLAAGQQSTADTDGVTAAAALQDTAVATAWRRGRLTFRLEPLRYVLEDINRYTRKPVVIEDERIGELRVTGTVVSSSVQGWVDSLESALGVEAVEDADRILIRRAR